MRMVGIISAVTELVVGIPLAIATAAGTGALLSVRVGTDRVPGAARHPRLAGIVAALDRGKRRSAGIRKNTLLPFHRDDCQSSLWSLTLIIDNDLSSVYVILNKDTILATVIFEHLPHVQGGLHAIYQRPLQLLI